MNYDKKLLSESTHQTEWMPSLHLHSDLVAMKSAFISALCWQTPLGTWTKHKQTGHKQLLLLFHGWMPFSICSWFRGKERRQNSTNYGIHRLLLGPKPKVSSILHVHLTLPCVCLFIEYDGWSFYASVYILVEAVCFCECQCWCFFLKTKDSQHLLAETKVISVSKVRQEVPPFNMYVIFSPTHPLIWVKPEIWNEPFSEITEE